MRIRQVGEYEVSDKGVELVVNVGDYGTYTTQMVLPKEIFIECYNKWIKEHTPGQEQRWIPVSERLPKAEYGESDSVLVCFENGTQDVLYFDGSNWRCPTGESYISVNHKNGWHNKVIAWMPLPKPFEPQESEG